MAEAHAALGHLLATLGQTEAAAKELAEAETMAREAKAEGLVPEILLGKAEVLHLAGQARGVRGGFRAGQRQGQPLRPEGSRGRVAHRARRALPRAGQGRERGGAPAAHARGGRPVAAAAAGGGGRAGAGRGAAGPGRRGGSAPPGPGRDRPRREVLGPARPLSGPGRPGRGPGQAGQERRGPRRLRQGRAHAGLDPREPAARARGRLPRPAGREGLPADRPPRGWRRPAGPPNPSGPPPRSFDRKIRGALRSGGAYQ